MESNQTIISPASLNTTQKENIINVTIIITIQLTPMNIIELITSSKHPISNILILVKQIHHPIIHLFIHYHMSKHQTQNIMYQRNKQYHLLITTYLNNPKHHFIIYQIFELHLKRFRKQRKLPNIDPCQQYHWTILNL